MIAGSVMRKTTKKEIPRSMEATDAPIVLSNIDESWYNSIGDQNNIGIQLSNNRIAGKLYDLVGMNGHQWKLWSAFPVEYLTGNMFHSFHRCKFVPTKSYDFPAILLFDSWIPMLFQLLIQSHYESSIFDSMISTLVASMDIGFSFLVVLCITFLATIAYIFCFTGFIFLRHFSHWVSTLHQTFAFSGLL